MIGRRGNLNVCDDCWVMVSMDGQNKYCSDVVMCDRKIEWFTQFQVSIIGTNILSHETDIEMVCQTKYYFIW